MNRDVTRGITYAVVAVLILLAVELFYLQNQSNNIRTISREKRPIDAKTEPKQLVDTDYVEIAKCGLHIAGVALDALAQQGVPCYGEGSKSIAIYVPKGNAIKAVVTLEKLRQVDIVIMDPPL